jgi:hypothetical protein
MFALEVNVAVGESFSSSKRAVRGCVVDFSEQFARPGHGGARLPNDPG